MNELIKPLSVGSLGPIGQLILEDVVATILDIIVKAWPGVIASGKVGPQSGEDDISNVFRWQLDAEKKRRRPKPRMRFERETQSDSPDEDRSVGLIDVCVFYSFEQEEYFAIECKRVTDADPDLSRLYVTNGVNRFVIGKYSLGHRFGAMVGYVCAGDCEAVAGQIERRLIDYDPAVSAFSTEWSWRRESRFGEIPHLFSSLHAQTGIRNEITLLHLFLSVC